MWNTSPFHLFQSVIVQFYNPDQCVCGKNFPLICCLNCIFLDRGQATSPSFLYFLMHLLNLSFSAFILIDSQGIIEDVVLLGAPVEGEAKYWKAITKVVSGRIINGYCRSVRAQSPASLSACHFGMFLYIYPF